MMVVEQKTTQPVEPNEKPVDPFSSIGWTVQKPYIYSKIIFQPVKF